MQSHFYVALDERFIDAATFESLYSQVQQVKALIGGFIRYLRGPQ